DDGPNIWFSVLMNGSRVLSGTRDTTATLGLLDPDTPYTFTVQAQDFENNLSPPSAPLTVTTEPRNLNDVTPPTTPANLTDNGMAFSDGETWLFWEPSTDDVDPQAVLRYDVYVNGVLDHSLTGAEMTIVYGNAGATNTFQVIAVDSAGNHSSPATLTVSNH